MGFKNLITLFSVCFCYCGGNLIAAGTKPDILFIFTADHGLAVGQHGLMGKQNMFEHSLRVPLMVVGPGVAKALLFNVKDDPYEMTDILPQNMERAKELFARLLDLQKETGDILDLKATFPDIGGE
jgi:glucan phosphoethanolaminetransferase (alkaline phosphatase superfamily)